MRDLYSSFGIAEEDIVEALMKGRKDQARASLMLIAWLEVGG